MSSKVFPCSDANEVSSRNLSILTMDAGKPLDKVSKGAIRKIFLLCFLDLKIRTG